MVIHSFIALQTRGPPAVTAATEAIYIVRCSDLIAFGSKFIVGKRQFQLLTEIDAGFFFNFPIAHWYCRPTLYMLVKVVRLQNTHEAVTHHNQPLLASSVCRAYTPVFPGSDIWMVCTVDA